jgi:hypothetical protein
MIDPGFFSNSSIHDSISDVEQRFQAKLGNPETLTTLILKS